MVPCPRGCRIRPTCEYRPDLGWMDHRRAAGDWSAPHVLVHGARRSQRLSEGARRDSTSKPGKRHRSDQIFRKLRDAEAMLNAGQDPAAVFQVSERRACLVLEQPESPLRDQGRMRR